MGEKISSSMLAMDGLEGVVDNRHRSLSTVGMPRKGSDSVCTCLSCVSGYGWQVFENGESVFESGVSKSDAVQSLRSVKRVICDSGILEHSFRVFSS